MNYMCEVRQLPLCCGFVEAGTFGDDVFADYTEDTPQKLLGRILEDGNGRPVIFNFVKFSRSNGGFDDDYQYDELRQRVLKYKNVIDLGEHINPNSYNKIHSLIIKDYK